MGILLVLMALDTEIGIYSWGVVDLWKGSG